MERSNPEKGLGMLKEHDLSSDCWCEPEVILI